MSKEKPEPKEVLIALFNAYLEGHKLIELLDEPTATKNDKVAIANLRSLCERITATTILLKERLRK